MVAIIAAVLAYTVSTVVAATITVLLSVPVALAAWAAGFRAGSEQGQEVASAAEIPPVELPPLRSVAIIDEHSPLYANWFFMLRLKEEVDRSARYRQKLALLVIQPAGDVASADLWQLTSSLRESVRTSDIPGHLDRERFAVILPNASPKWATQAKHRLRRVMVPFGYEVGCAAMPRDATDHSGLIAAAIADCASVNTAQQAA